MSKPFAAAHPPWLFQEKVWLPDIVPDRRIALLLSELAKYSSNSTARFGVAYVPSVFRRSVVTSGVRGPASQLLRIRSPSPVAPGLQSQEWLRSYCLELVA